jgi:putative SOS response-associated peptidase YedK
MCGRFSLSATQEILVKYFGVEVPELKPRYNIAPMQYSPVILSESSSKVSLCKWGLVPHFAKDESIGNQMINARAETIQEKSSFKNSFESKRCLVLADGFFEWKKTGSMKIPFRIARIDKMPFAFAGLYDTWLSAKGEPLTTFTIITVKPNGVVGKIHDRMPAILLHEDQKAWIAKHAEPKELMSLLKPYPDELIEAYGVSTLVNSPGNDVPEVIAKLRTL